MNSFFFSFSHLSIVLLRIHFVTPIKKQYNHDGFLDYISPIHQLLTELQNPYQER